MKINKGFKIYFNDLQPKTKRPVSRVGDKLFSCLWLKVTAISLMLMLLHDAALFLAEKMHKMGMFPFKL